MENSNGVAVLRIAFDGDDEREAERSTPAHATEVLKHPTTGARVDVVGTAHVSAQSARETRAVIMAARPDVVMVELDPARLNALVRDSQRRFPARAVARNVATHWDALRVIWNGRALNTMGSLGYAAVGAVLGSQPGAEFLAAIDAAKEVGAEVVLGDLDADVTMARVFARLRWRREIRARDRRRLERGENDAETETETEAEAETRAGENDADADDDEYVRLAASRERATIRYPTGRSARRRRLPAEALRLMRKADCDDVAVEQAIWELALLPETDANATAGLVLARECGEQSRGTSPFARFPRRRPIFSRGRSRSPIPVGASGVRWGLGRGGDVETRPGLGSGALPAASARGARDRRRDRRGARGRREATLGRRPDARVSRRVRRRALANPSGGGGGAGRYGVGFGLGVLRRRGGFWSPRRIRGARGTRVGDERLSGSGAIGGVVRVESGGIGVRGGGDGGRGGNRAHRERAGDDGSTRGETRAGRARGGGGRNRGAAEKRTSMRRGGEARGTPTPKANRRSRCARSTPSARTKLKTTCCTDECTRDSNTR